MTDNGLCNVKHKSSVYSEEYSLCDICAFNGFTNEKVIGCKATHFIKTENKLSYRSSHCSFNISLKGNLQELNFVVNCLSITYPPR